MQKNKTYNQYQPSLEADILKSYLLKNNSKRDPNVRKIKRSLRKLRFSPY